MTSKSNIFFELLHVKRNSFHVEQYSNLENFANEGGGTQLKKIGARIQFCHVLP